MDGLIIYRLKKSRWLSEMRITDVYLKSPDVDYMPAVAKVAGSSGANFVSVSALAGPPLAGMFHLSNLKAGPIVTIRDNGTRDFSLFREFAAWSPSLGDLELF
jgi:hypothetical protein